MLLCILCVRQGHCFYANSPFNRRFEHAQQRVYSSRCYSISKRHLLFSRTKSRLRVPTLTEFLFFWLVWKCRDPSKSLCRTYPRLASYVRRNRYGLRCNRKIQPSQLLVRPLPQLIESLRWCQRPCGRLRKCFGRRRNSSRNRRTKSLWDTCVVRASKCKAPKWIGRR